MKYLLACSTQWSATADGHPVCTGTLSVEEAGAGSMTLEDANQLKDGALAIFVVVFAVLALKKAL